MDTLSTGSTGGTGSTEGTESTVDTWSTGSTGGTERWWLLTTGYNKSLNNRLLIEASYA